METLTKKDLVELIATRLGIDHREAEDRVRPVLQAFLDELVEQMGRGRRVEFRDFGVFEVRTRAARAAQNPKTLEPVKVGPRRTVKFKPGRLMKDLLAKEPGSPTPTPTSTPTPGPGPGSGSGKPAGDRRLRSA